MDFQVARIEQLQAFLLPEVQEQLQKWTYNQNIWVDLVKKVQIGSAAVFVGGTRAQILAFAVVILPEDALYEQPQIAHFQCQGGPKLKNMLISLLVGWIKAHGYGRFTAINATGRPDSLWMRNFRGGGTPRKIASVIEFEIEGKDERSSKGPNRRKRQLKQARRLDSGRIQATAAAVLEQRSEPDSGPGTAGVHGAAERGYNGTGAAGPGGRQHGGDEPQPDGLAEQDLKRVLPARAARKQSLPAKRNRGRAKADRNRAE